MFAFDKVVPSFGTEIEHLSLLNVSANSVTKIFVITVKGLKIVTQPPLV